MSSHNSAPCQSSHAGAYANGSSYADKARKAMDATDKSGLQHLGHGTAKESAGECAQRLAYLADMYEAASASLREEIKAELFQMARSAK